jgi:hypothetical protein
MSELYTLETMSKRLGGIPLSTLKHRIQQLGIPASARGSRNKLLFDERALALLEASDHLMREGHGINTTRRLLKIGAITDGVPALPQVIPAGEGETSMASSAGIREGDRDRSELEIALIPLAEALNVALAQLEAKDRQLTQLQDDLRRTAEASATFQQKTFYLQGELQRLQAELKDARRPTAKDPAPWQRLWKRDPQ